METYDDYNTTENVSMTDDSFISASKLATLFSRSSKTKIFQSITPTDDRLLFTDPTDLPSDSKLP